MNEILLYGSVGESFWGEESFTAKWLREQLATTPGPVTIRLNSGGGIAHEGQAIYAALRAHDGPVHIVVEGVAASAASLIAMAGETITMTDGALMMIHDPANWFLDGRGTEDDHLRAADVLRITANAYAGIYAKRAGIPVAEAREIMRAETYYDGPSAVAAGFATAFDDEQPAIQAAAFDYAIYQHAPRRLMTAAGAISRPRPRATVLAMLAGTPPVASRKGNTMANSKANAATAADEDERNLREDEDEQDVNLEDDDQHDDDTEAEDEDEQTRAESEDDDTTADDEDDDEGDEQTRAVAVINMCASLGVSMTRAVSFVNKGMSPGQVYDAVRGKKGSKVMINGRGPRTRIMRDERETRRSGIEGALIARMARTRSVSGPARDYMGLSLAEMAQAASGQRVRIGRGADTLRTIEMALGSHSTSDFPAIFENALNKRLAAAYAAYTPVYQLIAERIDFVDFRPHPIAQIGDWPTLLPVGETGEIRYGTVGDKKESVFLIPYARAFTISREMMINDDLQAIERMLNTRGRAVAAFEDATFFAMMLSGSGTDGPTLLETSRQVFNATDGTKAGTASKIDPANIALGYKAMRERKGVSGETFIATEPRILLTGPAKEFEGLQLLAPIQAAQASNVNPYVGRLQQATTPYITGNAWYLFDDPANTPVFMYGYLQGDEGPRMRMDEPFGQQGVSYSVELDFGCGATDFRGGYKNAGA